VSAEAVIRASRPRSVLGETGQSRKRLALALALAAAIHLLAFMAADKLGFDYGRLAPALDIPPDRFLELYLELSGPMADSLEPPPAQAAQELSGQEGNEREAIEAAKLEEAISPEEALAALSEAALPYGAGILEGAEEAPAPSGEDRTVNLEETAPAFKSYYSLVRTAVGRHWILPPAARSNFRPGRFVASMTLGRDGQVLIITVEESSGIAALDFAAMEALRGAAPFPPFPPELEAHESINIRFHFDYRAVKRRPGSFGAYGQDQDQE
jgi:TonB family protein